MKNVCLSLLSKLLNLFKHYYFAKVYYKIHFFAREQSETTILSTQMPNMVIEPLFIFPYQLNENRGIRAKNILFSYYVRLVSVICRRLSTPNTLLFLFDSYIVLQLSCPQLLEMLTVLPVNLTYSKLRLYNCHW